MKEAQANGYAEQDPTADIEGHDACRKICILASLAFGRHIYPDQAPTQGITGVRLADVAYAGSCGKKIKLLSFRLPAGGELLEPEADDIQKDDYRSQARRANMADPSLLS